MARKLKTYQTSLGFFDQAIAAPSMKAALEAWGADSNLFHQGAAKESDDPDVIAATMAKPGFVLRRPVGSKGPFGENAELPSNLGGGATLAKAARKAEGRKPKQSSAPASRQAGGTESRALPTNESKRDENANRRKKKRPGRRSVNAVSKPSDKAQAALDKAERDHAQRVAALRAEIETIESKLKSEDANWDADEKRLKAALRRARE